jgi:hypothetical protein
VVRKATAARHSGLTLFARYSIFATKVLKNLFSSSDILGASLVSNIVSAAVVCLIGHTPQSERMSRWQLSKVMDTCPWITFSKVIPM